jgi:hypothetical protein
LIQLYPSLQLFVLPIYGEKSISRFLYSIDFAK